SAVAVVLQQLVRWLASELYCFKIIDANPDWPSFHFLTAPGQLVKFAAALLLRRIHRWHLIDVTTQTLQRGLDLFFAPPWARSVSCFAGRREIFFIVVNTFSRDVSGVSGIAEANHRLILFFQSTEKLRQARVAADERHQHA